jgi:hypothetical protein
MSPVAALATAALAAGALALELGTGGALPADGLLVVAVAVAGRPAGKLGAAALLGALRDGVAGGHAGPFLAGYLLAGLLARGALGGAGRRGMLALAVVSFLGALAAYLVATRSPTAALEVALATAVASPAFGVPIAATEVLAPAPKARAP